MSDGMDIARWREEKDNDSTTGSKSELNGGLGCAADMATIDKALKMGVMVAAQTAYEAYCNYTGWKSLVTCDDLPQWRALPEGIKNAWFAAISAVRA